MIKLVYVLFEVEGEQLVTGKINRPSTSYAPERTIDLFFFQLCHQAGHILVIHTTLTISESCCATYTIGNGLYRTRFT